MNENISSVVILEERCLRVNMIAKCADQKSYEGNGMIHFNFYRLIITQSIIKYMRSKTIDQNSKMLSPLQLMRQFYFDYIKTSKNPTKKKVFPHMVRERKYKTNSAQKITQFLHRASTTNSEITATIDPLDLSRKARTKDRSKTEERQDKRSYFKSIYSKNHPFLTSSHQFSQKEMASNLQKIDLPVLSTKQITNSPQQRRNELKQMKDRLDVSKGLKAEKFKRVRFNYLLNKCFKKEDKKDEEVPKRVYAQNLLATTKQRIFPQ